MPGMKPVVMPLVCVTALVGAWSLSAGPSSPGRFLLADGRSVADARVLFLKEADGGVEVRSETKSDAAGRLDAAPDGATSALLVAGPAWPPVVWDTSSPPPAVRLAGTWRIRVIAAAGGTPVEGAEVVAVSRDTATALAGLWPGTSGTTGRDGQARVPFASASDLVVVRARGYATSAKGRGGPVALERAAPLEGRLLDATGRPLPGRIVRAVSTERTGEGVVFARARTNERGGYRFEDVPESVRIVYESASAAPAMAERRGPAAQVDLVVPESARLRARFVDSQGRPVTGVEVTVDQFAADESLSVTRRGRSGTDGVASFAQLSSRLERARVVVRVPGGTFDSKVFSEPLGMLKDLGDWKLGPMAAATGTVVDTAGRPVAKAMLTYPRTGENLATTDAQGRFSARLMEGQSAYVTVEARGFVEEKIWIRTSSPSKVRLRRAAVLRAKPRLPDGTGPGAVHAVATSDRGWETSEEMKPLADGVFVLETESISTRLVLRVDGYEDADLGFVSVPDGEVRDFGVVEFYEGPSIRGLLVDAESGEALAGAKVTAQPVRESDLLDSLADARLPSTMTGADGAFRIGGLPEGDVRLWVEAPGFAVNRYDEEALPEGSDLGRVAVARGEPLELLVEYPDGTPAPSIAVVVRPGGFDGNLKEESYTTNAEGSLVIPRIAPGRHALRATVGTRYVRRLVTLDGEKELAFRLTGARVEGRVTVDGEPFPGVRVTLWYGAPGQIVATPDERATRDGIPLQTRKLGDWPLEPPTVTDAAGRFAFAEAGEGKASLRIEGSGWGAEGREIEVPSSGRLSLEIALGAVELNVRLVDEGGVPVAPGQLGVFGDVGSRLAASSVDSEGRAVFYLEGTGKARYLRGTDNGKRKGFRLLTSKDLTGEKVVDLVLGEGTASLAVEAMDADRRPSPAASLHLVNLSDRTVLAGRCDAEGRWRRSLLPEGRYRVVARGKEGGAGEAEVTVPERGEASLAVRMEEAGKLALRVEAPPAVDPTALRVKVFDSRGRDRAAEEEVFGRSAAPNDRGRYVLPALPPGRYRVEVSGRGLTTESAPLDVEANRTTTKGIRMK